MTTETQETMNTTTPKTQAQEQKSMAALAEIFRQNGIQVSEEIELADKSRKPRILVLGDEATGFRAADIALQHGYPLYLLECVYDVRGTPENRERHVNLASRRWRLKFLVRF